MAHRILLFSAEVFGMDILAPPAKELWGNTGGEVLLLGGGDGISIVIMASIQPPHSDNTQYQSAGFTLYTMKHTHQLVYKHKQQCSQDFVKLCYASINSTFRSMKYIATYSTHGTFDIFSQFCKHLDKS